MAYTISKIVSQFKADVGKALSAETIVKICGCLGHVWRERVFDPVTTVHVFLVQILHGNTACAALSRLTGVSFTGAAYCAARLRLPLALFEDLLKRVCEALFPELQKIGRWHGHRTWCMDGSGFSMSDTPELQDHFGQPGCQAKGCGFPVAHMLALFHAGTGLLLRVVASPLRTHDMRHSSLLHEELDEGDILLADRGFASFAHLARVFLRNMHAVFRCHQKQIVQFRVGRKHKGRGKHKKHKKGMPSSRYIRRLGHWDQLVEYAKPMAKPAWIEENTWVSLPDTLLVRELRYRKAQRGHRSKVVTLVTTLLDPVAYPATELADLYLSRWQIEVNIRHLKITMGMDILHCQTVQGVMKELHMFSVAYNLVRLVMLEASRRQKVPPDRISFLDALRWIRIAKPDSPLTPLRVNPLRPNRIEPRVLKRRIKEFPLMKTPRDILRKALARKKLVA